MSSTDIPDPSQSPVAVRLPVSPSAGARFVFTCEHASNALPPGFDWPSEDRWLVETHWAFDLGIAEVTRDLAAQMQAPAAFSRFSRLLVDTNRPHHHETTFRTHADGRLVHLNADLSEPERIDRARRFHDPYHDAVDRLVEAHTEAIVLSMHSFTPVYEGGAPRPMEIGVLFDEEEERATLLARALAEAGFAVALNAPYSGKEGLIYSASRHAARHERPALELEIRQDLATDLDRRGALIDALRRALSALDRV